VKATSSGVIFRWVPRGSKNFLEYVATRGGKMQIGYRRIIHNKKQLLVHRLVCEMFHGVPTKSKMQVNHLNGVKDDNRPSNLEWVTHRENGLHSINVLGNSPRKVKDEDAIALLDSGLSLKDTARMLGVSKSLVHLIRKGRKT